MATSPAPITPKNNSLRAGNYAGNFAKFGPLVDELRPISQLLQLLAGKFPVQIEQGICSRRVGNSAVGREFAIRKA
jgi:hypothetical protein